MSIPARGSMIKNAWIYFLLAVFVSGIATALEDPQPTPQSEITEEPLVGRAILVDLQGPIGPATMDFVIDFMVFVE